MFNIHIIGNTTMRNLYTKMALGFYKKGFSNRP